MPYPGVSHRVQPLYPSPFDPLMVHLFAAVQIIGEAIHIEERSPAEAEEVVETLRGLFQKSFRIGLAVTVARFGTGHKP